MTIGKRPLANLLDTQRSRCAAFFHFHANATNTAMALDLNADSSKTSLFLSSLTANAGRLSESCESTRLAPRGQYFAVFDVYGGRKWRRGAVGFGGVWHLLISWNSVYVCLVLHLRRSKPVGHVHLTRTAPKRLV